MIRTSLNVSTVRHPDDNRAIPHSVRAVMKACELIDQLVHPGPRVVNELDFCDWLMKAVKGKSNGKTYNCRFSKRCIETPFLSKSVGQVSGNSKNAPFAFCHVLAKDNNAGIALHFFNEGMIERIHQYNRFSALRRCNLLDIVGPKHVFSR